MKNNREKIIEIFNKYFLKIDPSEMENYADYFIVDGEWYNPIYGCDTLAHFIDDLEIYWNEKNEKDSNLILILNKNQKKLILSQLHRTIVDAPLIIQEMRIDCVEKEYIQEFKQKVKEMCDLKKLISSPDVVLEAVKKGIEDENE